MQEVLKFEKFITRPKLYLRSLRFDNDKFETGVIYTSGWTIVPDAKGVICRTWTLEGGDGGVDGADISH